MSNHQHGLFFYDPTEMIQKDERGYYRTWYCGICGNSFKNRDLNIRDASFGDDVGSRALQDAVVHNGNGGGK